MMKQILLASLIILGGTACQTGSQNEAETATPSEAEAPVAISSVAGCYEFSENNSKVLAQLEVVQDSVKGRLRYDFYEKDDNDGEFVGTLRGDTLLGVYTFSSEGQQSQREVAFLWQEDRLLEGYGNLQFDNEVQRFEATDALTFGQGVILTKTECNEDMMGCLIDFGFRWSAVRSACVLPAQSGTQLRPLAESGKQEKTASLIFSDDQQRAEGFLPNQPESIILKRTGEEGAHSWVQGSYALFPWKGYVLQYENTFIYGGA